MKNLKILSLSFFAFFFTISLFAQDFEGIIKLSSDSPYGLNADLTLKGNKVLMTQASKKGTVKIIFDNANGDMIAMTEEGGKKLAVKNNLNDNPYMEKFSQQMTKSADDFSYEVTDEKAVINGYNCVKIIGKDADSEGYAWITKDLNINFGDLMPSSQMQQTGRNPWNTSFAKEGMIMQMHIKESKTKKEWTMNTEVQEGKVVDTNFEVPSDYQLMDMTNMRQLMMDAQKDPEKMRQLKEMMQNMQN